MWKPSLFSLRNRAVGLVLLSLLPVLAFTVYSYFHQRSREIQKVQLDALRAAKTLAMIQEAMIGDTKRLLMSLSQLPEVQKFDRESCNFLFDRVMEGNPYYNNFLAVNLQGQLICRAPPARFPANYADRLWFKKVLQTKTFSIGECVKGRQTGKFTIGLAYPINNRQGDMQGVVMAGINLEWWGNLLSQMGFPPDTAVTLSDSSRKVLFRYPNPEKYLGKELPEALVKAIGVSNEGVAAGEGLVGYPRLFAFARLTPPWQDMLVSIGLSMDAAVAPVKHNLHRNLLYLFAVALLALAAAFYGGKYFVVQPVKQLRLATERLASGDLTVRSGSDYTVGEIGLLSRSFDQMADALQARQEDLKKERQRLFSLLDNLPALLYVKAEDYAITFANQVFRQLFGDPQGRKCYEIIAHRETPCPGCACQQALQTRTSNELELSPQGFPRTFQLYNYPFFDGSKEVLSLGIDITERQQAAKALAATKSKLETALASMTDAVFISDAKGQFIDFNEAFAIFHKFKCKEECPKTVAEFFALLEAFLPNGELLPLEQWAVQRALRGETATKAEYHLRRKDTGETWIGSYSFAPMRDQTGRIIGAVVSARDITLSKRYKEDLRESREQLHLLAMRLLHAQEEERKRLAAELHDELGHALLILKLSLTAIAQKLPPEQETLKKSIRDQLEYFDDIIGEVRRLYNNLSPGHLEDLGLAKALENLVEDFAEIQPNITWQVDLPELAGIFSLPTQTIVYRLVQEALTNIGKHAHPTQVNISAQKENGFVHLVIGDDGRGFDLSQVKQDPSRGLGLAAMQERLYSVGGSFDIWSQKEQGTRLTFIIPCQEKSI